jgi:hypothetical protein
VSGGPAMTVPSARGGAPAPGNGSEAEEGEGRGERMRDGGGRGWGENLMAGSEEMVRGSLGPREEGESRFGGRLVTLARAGEVSLRESDLRGMLGEFS